MQKNRFFLLTILLFIVFSANAFAGGWTPRKNGGYAKLWLRWQAADGFLDGHHGADHKFEAIGNYNELFLNAYLEYGILDRLTAVAFWPFLTNYFMSDINDFSYTGTGDPSLGLRLGLVQRRWVLSVQLLGTLPIANSNLRHPFFNTETGAFLGELRVGAGTWDIEPRVQTGIGWKNGHLNGEVGYRFRTDGFHTVFSGTAEAGYRIFRPLYGIVRIVRVRPVGSTTAPLDDSPTGIGNGTKYFGFSIELDWQRGEHFSLGLVGEGATSYSRQAGGPVFNVYGAWKW